MDLTSFLALSIMKDQLQEDEPQRGLQGLLFSTFSGVKDEFGKETVPPLPLLLDHGGEGQAPRSNAPFFEFPSGVLGEIVLCLKPPSLASFALVNWDCLQLARSRLFASVLFDYSDSSIALIAKLISEGKERVKSPNGTTSKPSIGACIRRITVATSVEWLCDRHAINLGKDFDHNDENAMRIQRGRIADASRAFFDSYLADLMTIITSRQILPHLELLDWKDNIALPQHFFEGLACSSIKHLKLCRAMVDEEFGVELPNKLTSGGCGGGWPLQTLQLKVQWNLFGKRKKGSTSSLCSSILRLCAPTLVSLNWDATNEVESIPHSLIADSDDQLQFPCLKHLRLGNIKFADSASLEKLLGENIVSLSVNIEKTPIHTKCFQSRGTIRDLKSFVWDNHDVAPDHPLDFLRANRQLTKLCLQGPMRKVLLETRVLPLISSSFHNLLSLSLVWKGKTIPDSALQIIATLKSLQQIHLSAGEQFGWRHNWLIDHDSMRKWLGSLPHLRKVAFSRDSYDPGYDVIISNISYYYADKVLDPDRESIYRDVTLDSQEEQDAEWEQSHREWMLFEARLYVYTLPNLEWLYFGQIPMSIKESKFDRERFPWPLCAERDDCWTVLRQMFGASVDSD